MLLVFYPVIIKHCTSLLPNTAPCFHGRLKHGNKNTPYILAYLRCFKATRVSLGELYTLYEAKRQAKVNIVSSSSLTL